MGYAGRNINEQSELGGHCGEIEPIVFKSA